ncbi:hypothetical protein EJP77_03695 [Paenibacillus zeisoli]|uniref:Uncharacterized protein n=1 Tax=Paenibacillus zeisoli TaxID=2496267 RepID=A0A433XPT6_9BACL|nr:hypothetical protein [Paenibacillus zeisoli]RUT36103.1 hypothetical protein EJP77_03695 [Paenibacillus zeisoli]
MEQEDIKELLPVHRYEGLFLNFSNKVHKVFIKLLIALLIGLFLFQTLLKVPTIRLFLSSAEHFEGKPLPPLQVLLEKFTDK